MYHFIYSSFIKHSFRILGLWRMLLILHRKQFHLCHQLAVATVWWDRKLQPNQSDQSWRETLSNVSNFMDTWVSDQSSAVTAAVSLNFNIMTGYQYFCLWSLAGSQKSEASLLDVFQGPHDLLFSWWSSLLIVIVKPVCHHVDAELTWN